MRKWHLIPLLAPWLLIGALAGCVSPEVNRQAQLNEVRAKAFVALMEEGKTTREHEQQFVRNTLKGWTAFREALGLAELKGERP